MSDDFAEMLQLTAGPVDLTALATSPEPEIAGDKARGEQALADMAAELADLQERLWAERNDGSKRRILLVLQGMDTSGKGGVIRKAVGLVDPQGVRITSFKAPTDEEPGYLGVFDRSHYEDVLIHRVRGFAEPAEIERRYGAINDFEQQLVDEGTTIIKCMLHVSADVQKERLRERLNNPSKHWKFAPGDIDERMMWPAYREAYQIALERTNTAQAPWYVVPADKKWFRNLAVAQLLLRTLRGMDLVWPMADFDVEAEKHRLENEDPVQ